MIKKLIMNADDFGMTQGNSIGILMAHAQGILTSTTCMMNMPYAEFALKEAKKFPKLVCNESLYIDSSLHHLPIPVMLYGLSIHYILDILISILTIKKDKLEKA